VDTGDGNIWGIHGGRTGDADSLFLTKNCIALGWDEVGDLGALAATREAFKARVAETYPQKKPGAIPVDAGQLFRFVHEMKSGDAVIYPSKHDRQVHLGRVEGGYVYDPKTEPSYPHRRSVKWLRSIPRTRFTQGALYEIGAAISLFLVRNYADEFRSALEGKSAPVTPVTQDETVAKVAKDIEEQAEDFVLKRLAQELKGVPLEDFIIHLLRCMGYQARSTPKNEPSVDVIAHKDVLGVEQPIIKVQVKSSEGAVTDKDVSALYGKLSGGESGLFITLGSFTPPARNFGSSKANLRLIDGEELVELIFQYYEKFDSRHRALLPLRRVYIPDPADTEAE